MRINSEFGIVKSENASDDFGSDSDTEIRRDVKVET